MTEIVLDIVKHKGKQVLLLKFPYDNKLITLAKQLPEAKWSNMQNPVKLTTLVRFKLTT